MEETTQGDYFKHLKTSIKLVLVKLARNIKKKNIFMFQSLKKCF